MATVRDQGKTAFVQDVLKKNGHANHKAVMEAWKSAGRDGSISETLVNKVRAEMGLTGNLRSGRKPANKNGAATPVATTRRATGARPGRPAAASRDNGSHSAATPVKATADKRTRVLTQLEGDIDEMIFEIKGVGGLHEFEEALRRARRILARSHHE
jgi:hypothetical protein